MDLDKVIYGLHSETRRNILNLLTNEDLSAPEIYQKLGNSAPVYRQSVNKSLGILEEAQLVKKYYNNKEKAIYYKISKKVLKICLNDLSIE